MGGGRLNACFGTCVATGVQRAVGRAGEGEGDSLVDLAHPQRGGCSADEAGIS